MTFVEKVWRGDSVSTRALRTALAPLAGAYGAVNAIRNGLYDRGVLPVAVPGIPTVSVGNLTVGGTGKTPVAAWLAARFRSHNARPAIVTRGYGGDEPLVHAWLNPDVPVVVNVDRAEGVREAARRSCDVAILDDGFQRRQLARLEDIVLVSADRWTEPVRLLPSGPWRERLSSLARATLVIITRKAADADFASRLLERLASRTRRAEGAVVTLVLDDLHDAVTGAVRPLSDMAGRRVLLAAGIGDPDALAMQLRRTGAQVVTRLFPDHHVYDSTDIAQLARDAHDGDLIVCTLKDAVKLAPRWPREGPPLWYVSLRCELEAGGRVVDALIGRVLAARHVPTLR